MTRPLVLLVGHCLPDSFLLSRAVKVGAPGAKTKRVNSTKALERHLSGASLLLINRVLVGRFETDSGVGLIARLGRETSARHSMILVSNHDDAQREAEGAGALRGFGKRDLGTTAPGRIGEALRAPVPDA